MAGWLAGWPVGWLCCVCVLVWHSVRRPCFSTDITYDRFVVFFTAFFSVLLYHPNKHMASIFAIFPMACSLRLNSMVFR